MTTGSEIQNFVEILFIAYNIDKYKKLADHMFTRAHIQLSSRGKFTVKVCVVKITLHIKTMKNISR